MSECLDINPERQSISQSNGTVEPTHISRHTLNLLYLSQDCHMRISIRRLTTAIIHRSPAVLVGLYPTYQSNTY